MSLRLNVYPSNGEGLASFLCRTWSLSMVIIMNRLAQLTDSQSAVLTS